jgi:hypothetical protein
MNVVFDSNVVFQDWYLEGPSMALLEKFMKLSGSRLVVPKIVLSEVVNKYKEKVSEKLSEINRLNGLLLPSKKLTHSLTIDEILRDYESALISRFTTLRIEQPDYSTIPHEDLVARDLSRRRPFQKSGKGYRDALLWEVVLRNFANSKTKTFLITNNFRDFGDKENKGFHDDLQKDLCDKGLPPESVVLYCTLAEFMNAHVKPALDSINEALPELMQGRYKGFESLDWFKENRESIGISMQESIESLFYELKDLEDPSVSYVEDPDKIEIQNVYELDIDRVYIDAFTKVDVIFDVFVFKSDYAWVSEKHDLQIWDHDWNKHYIFAQTTMKLPINLVLNFNIKNECVEDFEVNIVEFFGFCPNCSEPVMSDAAENCGECGKSFF